MAAEYMTLIATGGGIVGSLCGVIVGQRMSRSWQREQWVLDHRAEEVRELLDALANGIRASLTWHAGAVLDSEQQRDILATHSHAMRVIRSRVFIADEVGLFNLEIRWSEAVNHHRDTYDTEELGAVFTQIRHELINSIRTTRIPWYKRMFRSRKLRVSR